MSHRDCCGTTYSYSNFARLYAIFFRLSFIHFLVTLSEYPEVDITTLRALLFLKVVKAVGYTTKISKIASAQGMLNATTSRFSYEMHLRVNSQHPHRDSIQNVLYVKNVGVL